MLANIFHPKHIVKGIAVIVIMLVVALAGSGLAGPMTMQAQNDYMVFLPVFTIGQADTTSANDSEDTIDTSGWSKYTSQAGGY